MDAAVVRRRAPGMSPDQRREMVVRAALPLVAEFGGAVTTKQIARAAGIGEATIFRVFADKDELLDACILAAFDTSTVLAELGAIPLDQPLHVRLVDAADALGGHLDRMGSVIGALFASGYDRHRPRPDPDAHGPGPVTSESQLAIRDAIVDLLEHDETSLRLPPTTLADVFLALLFTRRGRLPTTTEVAVEDLVDLFLYGAHAYRSADLG